MEEKRNFSLGQIVSLPRMVRASKGGTTKVDYESGQIIFIHPEGRFISVQFPNGVECYSPYDLKQRIK